MDTFIIHGPSKEDGEWINCTLGKKNILLNANYLILIRNNIPYSRIAVAQEFHFSKPDYCLKDTGDFQIIINTWLNKNEAEFLYKKFATGKWNLETKKQRNKRIHL